MSPRPLTGHDPALQRASRGGGTSGSRSGSGGSVGDMTWSWPRPQITRMTGLPRDARALGPEMRCRLFYLSLPLCRFDRDHDFDRLASPRCMMRGASCCYSRRQASYLVPASVESRVSSLESRVSSIQYPVSSIQYRVASVKSANHRHSVRCCCWKLNG